MKTKIENFRIENLKSPIGLDTATPHYSWEFSTERSAVWQKSYHIRVRNYYGETVWDSGTVESRKTFGILHGGTPLSPDTAYEAEIWATLGDEELYERCDFRTGMLDEYFPDAKWIFAEGKNTSPLMRKTFFTEKRVAYATLYVAARGFYEAYLNGKRVGNRILAPAMLSNLTYPYHCNADAYDVTDLLTRDNNTLGVWLGCGYSRKDFSPWGWVYEGQEKMWCALSIVYEDTDTLVVGSDESWVWHRSPILENSIYHGETYKKSRELDRWCDPYFATSHWKKCKPSADIEGVTNFYTLPIVKTGLLPCKQFSVFEGEETVCDFGENGAGFLRIKVTGEPGKKVIIDHAENLNEDGTLNTFTNRDARARDVYILRGHEIEIYEPRFTYHCFRYARIRMEGAAQLISAQKVTIGTDFESCGSFGCDDMMLERMYNNAMRSVKSNLLSYPADCGSRDERTPCLMDSMMYEEFTLRNLYAPKYYRQWMDNCRGQSDPNGRHPMWNGDLISLPLLLRDYYGDEDTVKMMYPLMKKSIEESEETYKKDGFDGIFGDWCQPKAENRDNDYNLCAGTPAEAGLCNLIWQLEKMAELSKEMGEITLSSEYTKKRDYYQNELYRRFFDETEGVFSEGAQAPNLMALALGACREADRDRVYAGLKKHIKEYDLNHLQTGIASTRHLISVLSQDAEGLEILYDILHQTDFPSFGQQILEWDATTLCEQWFTLAGMMSCNHPMFSGIFADFSKVFAGIKNGGNCWEKIIIQPKLLPGINRLKCNYHSPRGNIEVFLRRVADKLHTDVSIPPNCTATVHLTDGRVLELDNGSYML